MPEWLTATINILTFVVMAVGLFSTLIPLVPGILIIWLTALGYGVVSGFSTLGWWMFGLITVLMLAGTLVDNVLMGAGAKQGGASWLAIAVGLLAGVIGTFVLPPFGGLLFAPVAVYSYEVYRQGSHQAAIRAIKGMAAGWGLSFAARFGIGLVMIFFWLLWAWKG